MHLHFSPTEPRALNPTSFRYFLASSVPRYVWNAIGKHSFANLTKALILIMVIMTTGMAYIWTRCRLL